MEMEETGRMLYNKLSELKYPNISKFNPSSFDWLFDNEEAYPFLTWFCRNVQSAHRLTSSELKRFVLIPVPLDQMVTILEPFTDLIL